MLEIQTIPKDHTWYPQALRRHLGDRAPDQLTYIGNPNLLTSPSFYRSAFFCSATEPQTARAASEELTASWREAPGFITASGFQSSVEAQTFKTLALGCSPIILGLPKGISTRRIKQDWRGPLSQGRLLIISFFPPYITRPTPARGLFRNRCLAAIADQIIIAYARTGSKTEKLAREALTWDRPVYALDILDNEPLISIGARRMTKSTHTSIQTTNPPAPPDDLSLRTQLHNIGRQTLADHSHHPIFHNALQTKLVDLAKNYELFAAPEYKLEKYPPHSRVGRIDVVWLDGVRPVVAIEIDTKHRRKSIQKLLTIQATYKFWIYRGLNNPQTLLKEMDPHSQITLIWLQPQDKLSPQAQQQTTKAPDPSAHHQRAKSKDTTTYHQRIAKIRIQSPRAYLPWTPDDERLLLQKYHSGASIKEIAKSLQRQPGAIKSRIRKLTS